MKMKSELWTKGKAFRAVTLFQNGHFTLRFVSGSTWEDAAGVVKKVLSVDQFMISIASTQGRERWIENLTLDSVKVQLDKFRNRMRKQEFTFIGTTTKGDKS